MKLTLRVIGILLIVFTASAQADDKEALIALDKQWAESIMKGDLSIATKLLAETVVSVDETGVRGKKAELASYTPAPAGARYEPVDYKVTLIDPNTAIMTHSTKGEGAHHSLHVWSRKGETWQLIATSSTPVAKGE